MAFQTDHCEDAQFLTAALGTDSVPVVFAANDGFVPMFSTCLQSLIDHASQDTRYDVVLIHQDISPGNRAILLGQVQGKQNISLRFFNAAALIRDYDLKANAHISVETYFRFLIQSILPDRDKVLYLDCDLILNADPAELYQTDVSGYLLAAARDPEFSGHLHGANRSIQKYILNELNMKDPSGYFQAGVILFNEAEMRKAYTLEQWLSFASVPYRYNDQDVLNKYCEGRVKYLDMSWNLITDCDHTRVSQIICHAPAQIQAAYSQAQQNPKIIHYAGYKKPWHNPNEDKAQYFWQSLRKTPYYEVVLYAMVCRAADERIEARHRAGSPYWKLRRAVKKWILRVTPEGSKRQNLVKRIVRRK